MIQTQLLKADKPYQIICAAGMVGVQVATLIVTEDKMAADGSYQMAATNASTGQSQNSSGTWSMAGNTVTMTDSNTGGSENFTYANGRLASLETTFMYFTK